MKSVAVETSNELERAIEDQTGGKRVQAKSGAPGTHTEVKLSDDLEPTRLRPIGVWQRHAVPSVPDSVHEPECPVGKKAFKRLILDHQATPGHAPRFG